MRDEQLTIDVAELRARLLPHLRGRVFHVTNAVAWPKILASSAVLPNSDGSLGYRSDFSKGSAVREAGMISLCDLRAADEEDIEVGLGRYFFLNPGGRSRPDPVFLLLSSEAEERVLAPPGVAQRFADGGRFVPRIEGAFPGELALHLVETVLHVSVIYQSSADFGGDHLRALLRFGSRKDD